MNGKAIRAFDDTAPMTSMGPAAGERTAPTSPKGRASVARGN